VIVTALAVAALFPILWNGFVWDDVPETFSIEYTSEWQNIPWFFTSEVSGYYRPIRSIVYLVGRNVFGESPAAFHALSLLWHVLGTLAATWFVFVAFRDRRLALVTGVIFAVHPVHTEAVAWVTASSDPLVAPLIFLAIGLFVQARRSEEVDPRRSRKLTFLGSAATLAACFTKEVAVVLFLVVALLEWLPLPGAGRATRTGRILRIGSSPPTPSSRAAARPAPSRHSPASPESTCA
jgi:4-amino-4-deoxy-L-arabinose transferase-like glycosyltransferase